MENVRRVFKGFLLVPSSHDRTVTDLGPLVSWDAKVNCHYDRVELDYKFYFYLHVYTGED